VYFSGKSVRTITQAALPYDRYTIEFQFNAVHYSDEDVYFMYKLEGVDEEWQGPVNRNFVVYSGIQNGKYTFKVKPFLLGKNTKTHTAEFVFEVHTPIWKNKWFYIILALLIIITTYISVRLRIRKIRLEKIRLEKIVRKRTNELRVRNKQLEKYAYAISHDIKNPLQNMQQLISILKTEPEKDTQVINLLEKTTSSLYNETLALLKLMKTENQSKPEVSEVSINSVIDDVLLQISELAKKENARIIKNLHIDKIKINPQHLRIILYNLIVNAIKYKHPNRTPEIQISSRAEENCIILEIKDNGQGIDMNKNKDKLFKEFQRIDTQKEGTGLGLSLVSTIVKSYNAEVKINSKLNEGTTITIWFCNLPEI
jgi:signal transduction histidine kinase